MVRPPPELEEVLFPGRAWQSRGGARGGEGTAPYFLGVPTPLDLLGFRAWQPPGPYPRPWRSPPVAPAPLLRAAPPAPPPRARDIPFIPAPRGRDGGAGLSLSGLGRGVQAERGCADAG